MRAVDVNVLIYAHRVEVAGHVAWRTWCEALMSDTRPFALSVLSVAGFVRIVTHRRAFDPPTPTSAALAVVENITSRLNCRILQPGPRHLALFADLCRATGATGKLVADAQHAAVAIEHGCEWLTADSDFARFESHGLRWRLVDPTS